MARQKNLVPSNGSDAIVDTSRFDQSLVATIRSRHNTSHFTELVNAANNMIVNIIGNTLSLRQRMLSDQINDKRNIDKECGYPETIEANTYYEMWDRNPIPARVVELFPKECWQVSPVVYEEEDEEVITPFEEAWKNLCKTLGGEKSWLEGDEEYNPINELLYRADEISGIGHYGIIYLGFNDITSSSMGLMQPVQGFITNYKEEPTQPRDSQTQQDYPITQRPQKMKGMQLMFARTIPEHLAYVTSWENNRTSPRYQMPIYYNVTFNDPREGDQAGIGLISGQYQVHWSRVIHIADNSLTNPTFGIPRMKQIFNNLLDLRKEYSSSAEALWQQAFATTSVESIPQLGAQVKINEQSLKDMFELVRNGIQKEIYLRGMTAKKLQVSTTDPTSFINAQIEAICIKLGCPVRIFKGSERGELASTQDDEAWNDRVKERQRRHVTTRIIAPFVNRLIQVGVLPEPKSFKVFWPDITSTNKTEKSSTAVNITRALAQYAESGLEEYISRQDYYVKVIGLTQDEAKEIIENTESQPNPNLTQPPIDEQEIDTPDDTDPSNPPNVDDDPISISPRKTQPDLSTQRISNIKDTSNIFCPTGKGGGVDATCGSGRSRASVPAPTVPEKEMSEKAKRAQESAKRIAADVQRYAEEHNEPKLAKAIGGEPEANNKPYDVLVKGAATQAHPDGKPKHGVEMKTMVDNKNNKLTMSSSAQDRKIQWEKDNNATFHTVVYDDQAVFNANGPGQHDESKRVIYYRRGGGSFRVGGMYQVKDHDELVKLMNTPTSKLPDAAKPSPQWIEKQQAARSEG